MHNLYHGHPSRCFLRPSVASSLLKVVEGHDQADVNRQSQRRRFLRWYEITRIETGNEHGWNVSLVLKPDRENFDVTINERTPGSVNYSETRVLFLSVAYAAHAHFQQARAGRPFAGLQVS